MNTNYNIENRRNNQSSVKEYKNSESSKKKLVILQIFSMPILSLLFILITCSSFQILKSNGPQVITQKDYSNLQKQGQENGQDKYFDLFKLHEKKNNQASLASTLSLKYNLNDVILYHPLPSVVVAGQYFIFEGQVNPIQLFKIIGMGKIVNKRYYNLLFALKNIQTSESTINRAKVGMDNKKFIIQQKFNQVGSFYFGIFLEEVGFVDKIVRVVQKSQFVADIGQLEPLKKDRKTAEIQIQIQENQFIVKWVPITRVSRMIISQLGREKIFIISNNKGFFKLPLQQFSNFTQVETKLSIQHADSAHLTSYYQITKFSEASQIYFLAINHLYMDRNYDLIQFIPNKINNRLFVNDKFYLSGFCSEEIRREAFIIKPDGQISQVSINFNSQQTSSQGIPPFTKFQISFILDQNGTYVLEINHQEGFAVLNIPLYSLRGNQFPLLPDPINLRFPSQTIKESNLENLAQQNLNQVNQIRQFYKKRPLRYTKDLSALAAAHNKDMISKNYISHINKQNLSPRNRAQIMGIFSRIGENIIVDPLYENLQKKLNRSPLHLRNTIDQGWSKVGIELAQDSRGMFYLTQQFAQEEPIAKSNQFFMKTKSSFLQLIREISNNTVIQNSQLSFEINKIKYVQSTEYLASIKQFLLSQGIKSAKLISISVPIYVQLKEFIKKTESSKLTGVFGRKYVGLSIKEEKGSLKIIALFY